MRRSRRAREKKDSGKKKKRRTRKGRKRSKNGRSSANNNTSKLQTAESAPAVRENKVVDQRLTKVKALRVFFDFGHDPHPAQPVETVGWR
jgi:hypothetical protein